MNLPFGSDGIQRILSILIMICFTLSTAGTLSSLIVSLFRVPVDCNPNLSWKLFNAIARLSLNTSVVSLAGRSPVKNRCFFAASTAGDDEPSFSGFFPVSEICGQPPFFAMSVYFASSSLSFLYGSLMSSKYRLSLCFLVRSESAR